MKTIFTFLSFILSGFALHAQNVIFSQNFDKLPGYAITGWNTSTFSGSVPWRAGLLYDINSTCFPGPDYERIAGICDCQTAHGGGGANHNVLMYTPKIDLTGVTGAWLKFDSYFRKATAGSKTEKATIEISTNGGANWTVLLDVPANQVMKVAEPFHIDLGAYSNMSDVRIGFRFNDNGLNIGGWAVDNVMVYEPANKDLSLLRLLPIDSLHRYAAVNNGLTYSGEVYNGGLDTAHSFVLNYQQAGQPVKSDTVTGIALPRFTKLAFTHNIPDTVKQIGVTPVKFWVELAGDAIHKNDSITTDIRGAHFMPRKKLVIEEGTGTWNNNCPEGWVLMNRADSADKYDMSLISVHGGEWDPMELDIYNDHLFDLGWNYIPFFLFDRRYKAEGDSFMYYMNYQKRSFGFANVDFDYYLGGNELTVNAHVTPAVDMEGDFRLALVLTEDNVSGTGNEWRQGNKFANNKFGPMGGFESKPDTIPASDMHYNFVARSIEPSPEGKPGGLPKKLIHNVDYAQTLKTPVDPLWNKERLRLIVLLIRYDDSTILNSNKMMFYLNASKLESPQAEIFAYPNPTSNIAHIKMFLKEAQQINWSLTDLAGRVLQQNQFMANSNVSTEFQVPVNTLPTGTYIINVASQHFKKSIKLSVIH